MPRHAVAVLLLVLSVGGSSSAQQPTPPKPAVPVEPITAILDAYRSTAIVALSEGTHGSEQSLALQLSLIRDPRFPAIVNDIVLEGPSARYQDVMDHYVRGDDVPVDSLRRVWDDTTQQQAGGPMWTGEVPEFYRAVRQLNALLPAERQLRILLGDPPIDWNQVHAKEDHAKWIALRDTFPAQLIEREVLAKHRHALLVFGNMHFQRKNLLANYESAATGPAATVVSALEESGSAKVFSIWAATDADLAQLQPDVSTWRTPSLAFIRDTVLGVADFTAYYPFETPRFDNKTGNLVPRDQWHSLKMEDQFDAVLYLGPRSSITVSPVRPSPAICADPSFLEKRLARVVLTGLPPREVERVKELCVQQPR